MSMMASYFSSSAVDMSVREFISMLDSFGIRPLVRTITSEDATAAAGPTPRFSEVSLELECDDGSVLVRGQSLARASESHRVLQWESSVAGGPWPTGADFQPKAIRFQCHFEFGSGAADLVEAVVWALGQTYGGVVSFDGSALLTSEMSQPRQDFSQGDDAGKTRKPWWRFW